ncbi:TauD/TfdA family dioxygenase [Lysinibacillus sp. NPDC059133]|uniref:TauD/TfdA family dioxygenase n=1 Tax=Lysinibacillus sp. NPDC059133 TaxID=3346737 RepID=UPI003680D57E
MSFHKLQDYFNVNYSEKSQNLPLILEPKVNEFNLIDWISDNKELINKTLLERGGILFRGFNVNNSNDFSELVNNYSSNLVNYIERTTPRLQMSDNIYTSTEHPANQTIEMHNELSYSVISPQLIWFYCLVPPKVGGETPIADVRRVYNRIPEEIIKRFENKGWMLVRNYGDGFGPTWQEAFNTTDKTVVEEYCNQHEIDFEWKTDDRLRTKQVRQAVRKHKMTNEMIWFNHVSFYHVYNLSSELRELFLSEFGLENIPFNTYYGDGSIIEDNIIEQINLTFEQEKIEFKWEKNDVMLLDNYLVAHSRNPFQGERKVLVAMGN